MKLDGRQKEIFDLLCERKRASVAELASTLYVSEMTVRRDLTEMEQQGFLRRYRGGAVLNPPKETLPVAERHYLEEEEKRALALAAAPLLADGLSVYIDSSSTAQYLLPHIKKHEGIRVITNSVAALLGAEKLHIPCLLIGGDYYERDMCLVGPMAERCALDLNVDIGFFSAQGISDDGIISDSTPEQGGVRLAVMKNAKRSVFLFEKGKFGKKYLYTLCRSDEVEIITAE